MPTCCPGWLLTGGRESAAAENSTAYFPLLDRIAQGAFTDLDSDKSIYEAFVRLLHDDGHITSPEAMSSFKMALTLHTSAPKIEAQHQYYNYSIAPNMMAAQDAVCPVWVHFDGKQYCSPTLERAQQDVEERDTFDVLPFDRVLGEGEGKPQSILYADITHPLFAEFHETVSRTAKEGKSTYRLRYRPSTTGAKAPLYLSGFGVQLALKRTDYIVIDDRDKSQAIADTEADGDENEAKPLTTAELIEISMNTASYVMDSENALDTLLDITADFPKHASQLSSHNASGHFKAEHKANRGTFLPSGYNILWMNGLQIEARQMNTFSLLDTMRRERQFISQLSAIGMSNKESIGLLSHQAIAQSQIDDDPQRYELA